MSSNCNQYQIEQAIVVSQESIATDIFSMWIKTSIALSAKPGQFISLFTRNGATLLPRPISICEIDRSEQKIRIVYRVVGKGTNEFSKLTEGETIKIMGPLGNGYNIKDKDAILAAGGIGIPPLVALAKELSDKQCKLTIVVGYRSELFLVDELKKYGAVYISTEDGSTGTKGNIMDVISENKLSGDIFYACGPMPMLKAVKMYAEVNQIEAQISLEERMACGIGACLGCVCKTKNKDAHTYVNNTRICTDGPVFDAREVEI